MGSEQNLNHQNQKLRYEASLNYYLQKMTYERNWPRACAGAANAWLILCGPSPGKADSPDDIWKGGPGRPVDELQGDVLPTRS